MKYKLIYNHHSGEKKLTSTFQKVGLEDILLLFKKHKISVDRSVTKHGRHAFTLAQQAVKDGYDVVIAAGGDGTVGQVANAIMGSKTTLGILPLGTFMNLAKMLGIPNDLETAVLLIKNGKMQKIDVGEVTCLEGKQLSRPHYFLESIGVGIEAQLHEQLIAWEHGSWRALFRIIKMIINYYLYPARVILDNEKIIRTKTSLITVANGPYTGANLKMAPRAKLDDHRLTVSVFRMSKIELLTYLLRLKLTGKAPAKKAVYRASTVKIVTHGKRMVHADAVLFGETPVELKIHPNAIRVITGFAKDSEGLS